MNGFPMKNQTFEEYAATWIYLLSATDNRLALVPCRSDFAYEFKWQPRDLTVAESKSSEDAV